MCREIREDTDETVQVLLDQRAWLDRPVGSRGYYSNLIIVCFPNIWAHLNCRALSGVVEPEEINELSPFQSDLRIEYPLPRFSIL